MHVYTDTYMCITKVVWFQRELGGIHVPGCLPMTGLVFQVRLIMHMTPKQASVLLRWEVIFKFGNGVGNQCTEASSWKTGKLGRV